MKSLHLSVLAGTYAVVRLAPSDVIPAWAYQGNFFSITKTTDEISLVCEQSYIPNGIVCETDWRILKVEGPLDFSLTGILSSLAEPLARHGVSIFALSTYDTDYVLVKTRTLESAVNVLTHQGCTITR